MCIKNLFLIVFSMFLFGSIQAQEELEEDRTLTESSPVLSDKYIDGIVKQTLVEENFVIQYEPVREADIAWQKTIWRVVDVREKMNLPFMNPGQPFFNIIRDLALNGDIVVFKPANEEGDFLEPMTIDEVDGTLNRIDTTTVFDYDTYEEQIKIVRSQINYEDIKQFRLKEMWFFDEEASRMKVRLLTITPLKDFFDESTGEYKYTLPLFNVYYPESREFFAKKRYFNEQNNVAPLSWYDVFEARNFASYVYKVSNTLDYRIEDKFTGYERAGIDRLMESEKIKEELFNFEHDLWTY